MNPKQFLVPTDFSTPNQALAIATMLAREVGAKIWIVHVIEIPIPYGDGKPTVELIEQNEEALERLLENEKPSDATISCGRKLLQGDPAEEILKFARAMDIDMIVMNTHGRTGVRRLLMGSVAEAVVRRSICPVLTCKQSEAAGSEHIDHLLAK